EPAPLAYGRLQNMKRVAVAVQDSEVAVICLHADQRKLLLVRVLRRAVIDRVAWLSMLFVFLVAVALIVAHCSLRLLQVAHAAAWRRARRRGPSRPATLLNECRFKKSHVV